MGLHASHTTSRLVVAVVVAAFASALLFTGGPAATGTTSATPVVRTAAAIQFRNEMRRLWEEHVTWTRLFIVSFANGLPDVKPTEHRLLRNQADLGDALKPFYGNHAGEHLTELLTRHIVLAAKILEAAKSRDTHAFDRAKKAWYANARRIAGFLHSLNPDNWPLAAVRQMMDMHLDLTLEEASDYLTGRYSASVHDFDKIEAEILKMADALSIGIIKQFPSQFS